MAGHESIYVRRDRLAGGLQGLLIGDALGVPYEFHDPSELPPLQQIDFEPPAGFPRSHKGVPSGTWSDDGAQALCLLESLLAKGTLDLGDFSRRVVDWADRGHLAVDGKVFDIGTQTARAIARLRAGVAPREAGPSSESDNGNGSLMRVLPLALWHTGDDSSLIAMAAEQSLPTHGHPRAAVACALLCLWARAEIQSTPSSWERAEAILRQLGPANGLPLVEIDHVLDPSHGDRVAGSGYVVDTLWSARQSLEHTGGYTDAVRHAVGLGRDTDTTAAVVGGLAGIRYGLYGIPLSWRKRLRGVELFKGLQDDLVQCVASTEYHSGQVIRTSLSHPLRIGTINPEGGGRIGITFCPGKKQASAMSGHWDRDLDIDLQAIRGWGATHLVTLIAPWEFEELSVTDLPTRAAAHGLIWHHAPILDGHVPGIVPDGEDASLWFEAVWPKLRTTLLDSLAQGEGVVVHCKGGLGRAGTVAAMLLAEASGRVAPDDIIQRVRGARPNAIETVAQEQYLRQYSPRKMI